ncbi:MAG: hypothetical protein FWG91_12980 [Lachnospiraceae bacterium]|nr:hypothetical protein [Lachnospiraceae bacterium]
MSKEILYSLIDRLDEEDSKTIYNVLIKFIPTEKPELDEIEAIIEAKESIAKDGLVPAESILTEAEKRFYLNAK